MNYFVEGLQGSGKSTLVSKLQELHPELKAVREGEYSPVELAWCAYLDEEKYPAILGKCGFQVLFTGEGPYHDDVCAIEKSVWKA